jgi:hypothetical protein
MLDFFAEIGARCPLVDATPTALGDRAILTMNSRAESAADDLLQVGPSISGRRRQAAGATADTALFEE